LHGPMGDEGIAAATGLGIANIRDRLRWMALGGRVTKIAMGLYATLEWSEAYERWRGERRELERQR
jgi:hypothetical protein